jgi:hypothetical protein
MKILPATWSSHIFYFFHRSEMAWMLNETSRMVRPCSYESKVQLDVRGVSATTYYLGCALGSAFFTGSGALTGAFFGTSLVLVAAG